MIKKKILLIFIGIMIILNSFLVFSLFEDNGSLTQTLYDCGTLNTTNAVYTLNQSIDGSGQTCITVQADNVTIDFNGYNITGDSSGADLEDGIYIDGYNDTKIINGIVSGFTRGVYSANNYGLNISGGNYSNNGPADDTISNNDGYGIYLSNSNNFTLSNFPVRDITESGAISEVIAPSFQLDKAIVGIDAEKDIFGIGESIDWLEKDDCYGNYCNLSNEELSNEIDKSVDKAIDYEINNYASNLENDNPSNNFNVLFLLKYANEVKQNDKIENALPNMTREFTKTLTKKEYDMYMPLLNQINPEFNLSESNYYNGIKENAQNSDDFRIMNRQLGIFAYYCKDVFMNYGKEEKDWIINYFLNTSLGDGMNETELTNYSNQYYATTHSLFYLNMMYEQGCIDKEAVDKAAEAVLFRSKLLTHYSDPNLEAPMVLLLSNHSELVRKNWMPIILENQRNDGGGSLIQQINESHSHPTGVALLSLLAYKEYVLDKNAFNISIPFKPLKEDLNLSGIVEALPEHHSTYCIYIENSNYGVITGVNGSGSTFTRSNYGIYLYNSNYTTINSSNMSNLGSIGFYLESSNNNILSFNTASSDSNGIFFDSGSNNTIQNNIMNLNYVGLTLNNLNNNMIFNNTFNSSSGLMIDIYNSNNNNVSNNNLWNCSSSFSTYGCIRLYSSDYNILNNNKIDTSFGYGIQIFSFGTGDNSSNNVFRNTNMTNIEEFSVYLYTNENSHTLNNTFINFTYNSESVMINSSLIRKWYYKAYANWSSGGIVNSGNVWALNKTNGLEFNATISSGTIPIQEITDYINNGTAKNYYSLYNITATNGTISSNHSFNASLGNNLTDYFVLEGVGIDTCTPPSINNDWNVKFEDNCVLLNDTDLGIGSLNVYGGSGTFTLLSNLTINRKSLVCTTKPCSFILINPGRLIEI